MDLFRTRGSNMDTLVFDHIKNSLGSYQRHLDNLFHSQLDNVDCWKRRIKDI